jgi:bifunctional enzyme CysN/CysC
MVVWMTDEPLAPGKQYWFKQATKTAAGTIEQPALPHRRQHAPPRRGAELKMNEVGRCKITLTSPIAFDPYRKNRNTGAFIFIDRLTNATVGAGMIIDRESTLGGFGADLWDVVEAENRKPQSVDPVELAERTTRRATTRRRFSLPASPARARSTTPTPWNAASSTRRQERLRARRRKHAARHLEGPRLLGLGAFGKPAPLDRSRQDSERRRRHQHLRVLGAGRSHSREGPRDESAAIASSKCYLKAPLDVLRKRDAAGMYAKADSAKSRSSPASRRSTTNRRARTSRSKPINSRRPNASIRSSRCWNGGS